MIYGIISPKAYIIPRPFDPSEQRGNLHKRGFSCLVSAYLSDGAARGIFHLLKGGNAMSLKYTCPNCGTPLGYKGLCWKCKAEFAHQQYVRHSDWTGYGLSM